ncbi:MAG: protease modulator HflC [Clostridiales bacterium]|nr:protease modulator HflC [Clostridiales bacterium]
MSTININDMRAARNRSTGRTIRGIVLAAAILVGAIVLFNIVTFTVGEGEQAVVSRFGVIRRIIIDPDNDFAERHPDLVTGEDSELNNVAVTKGKGLFIRIPFIDTVEKFNSRLFTYVSGAESVNTSDKKQYYITMYAQWRIIHPGLFAITHQTVSKASNYLDNLIYPVIIQNVNQLMADDFISNKELLSESLSGALTAINKTVRGSGIELSDIQVHRTSLPPANLQSTYERMQADRAKVAQQLRAEGDENYQKAVSAGDREARELVAQAVKESEQIHGEADAEALAIYAEAYSADPEFYEFWRSLQALKSSLSDNTTLVLEPDHPLWARMMALLRGGDIASRTVTAQTE